MPKILDLIKTLESKYDIILLITIKVNRFIEIPLKNPKKTEKQTKQPAKKVAKKKLPPKKIWLSATAIILVFSLLLALVIPRQVALSRDVSRQIDQPDQAIFSQGETIAQGAITPEGGDDSISGRKSKNDL